MHNQPQQPLDELEALRKENERLMHMIAVKNAAIQVARDWISSFGEHAPIIFGGEAELDSVLQMALDAK